jgi:two-component system, NtrC family, sensor kinase
MGRLVQVTAAPSYDALTQAVEEKQADIAWGTAEQCTQLEPQAWAVLRAVRFGNTSYHGALVCRADDHLTLESLRGRRAAWVNSHSQGGYLLIKRQLEALGHPPATLFSDERFVGSYLGAVRAVISGEADVTSVLASQPTELHAQAFMSDRVEGTESLLKAFLFSDPAPADGLILTRRLSQEDAAALISIIVDLSKGGTGLDPMMAPFSIDGFLSPPGAPLPTPSPWLLRGVNFLALTLDEEDRCRGVWAAADTALGRDVRGAEGRMLTEVLGAEASRLQATVRLARHDGTSGRVKYFQHVQGELRSYDVEVTARPSRPGQPQADVFLQLRDVTERSPLEDNLFRLASFPLMHPAPILELEMTGALRYVNPAAHEFFPDLMEQGPQHPVIIAAFAGARTGEEAELATVQHHGRYWELAVVPLPANGVLRVFAQDVTTRKQMELQEAKWAQELQAKNEALNTTLSQLREAQNRLILQDRLAALGTLTAGIAHELRNPLNFVNSFSSLAEELCGEVRQELETLGNRQGSAPLAHLHPHMADLTSYMRKIQEHGHRMERIIHAMLEHSQGGQGERREVSLNELLADSINLVYHGRRSSTRSFTTRFEQKFDESIGTMWLVPQEISRIAINLLENACYAVTAKRQALGGDFQGQIQVKTFNRNDCVEIHFHDNGTGIPHRIRDKLMTPFFTTKPTGEGTGLGLSLSHEIIAKGYGGTLRFESEEGESTTFIITLPR